MQQQPEFSSCVSFNMLCFCTLTLFKISSKTLFTPVSLLAEVSIQPTFSPNSLANSCPSSGDTHRVACGFPSSPIFDV